MGPVVRIAALAAVFAIVPAGVASAQADPAQIAQTYVRDHAQDLGVSRADVAELTVASSYRSSHTGVTHVNLNQRRDGLEIFGAYATVNVAPNGTVLFTGDSLVGRVGDASGARSLGAPEAVEKAADALGAPEPKDPRAVSRNARLGWQPTDDGLRLAWQLTIDETDASHLWNATVDAENGKLLARDDWTDHDSAPALASALARPNPEASQAPMVAPPRPVRDGSSYQVFALPTESPNERGRRLVFEPADALASPFGWHDVDGARGPEFTTTRGNNVHAYTDRDADDAPDPGSDPNGGKGLDFRPPLDLDEDPYNSSSAAVSNLFYWNNIVHDITSRYGFDEAAGNFQVNNYGRGGAGGDVVRAEAQDGSGDENANFTTTAPDGTDGARMQMYLWPALDRGLPNAVTVKGRTYLAQFARFSPAPTSAGRSGRIVAAGESCDPLAGFPRGAIALIDRGNCEFATKARHAEAAGAAAVVIANDRAGEPETMTGTMDPPVRIPVVMVSLQDGSAIKAGLPATGRVHRNTARPPIRDGDFDAGIVIHEYMHGVSNRLTGGATVNCLFGDEDMGEGWSDYMALALLLDPALDHPEAPRNMGAYALFGRSRRDTGIRPAPYSRNMEIQPSTYDSIKRSGWFEGATLAQPHGIGHVWGAVLWDMTWDLIDRHGFNRNVYAPWHTGGNNLAIQLVLDGLKMQGCFPGFVVARDAIIAADEALTGGDNACTLWASFARRGLGYSATQGLSFLRNDNSEAFDTHPDCRKGFTSGISPGPALNRVRAGDNVALRFKADRPRGHRDVLASNSPFSRRVDCQTLKTKGPGPYITPRPLPEPTRTPGWSRLTYERHGDRYMYPWKTLRDWEGTCREVVVTRADGVQHRAYFRFTPDAPPEEPPVLERWQARYNGHGDGQDYAQDAVMSADGSRVYVTGQSLGETTAFDYATVAYDVASGEQLWVARYNGPPGDGHDVAWTLKLSPDGSRLFVTGQSVTSETSSTDYATVAYDTATGRELWAAREASPDEWSLDIAYAIDVSRDGTRVFVTGQMLAGASSLDYATAAYDAATGERLWLTRYNGPFPFGNASDIANAVAVSADGSRVFVTGESSGVSSGQDITTVAYEAETGRELWVGRYNGPANFNDEAAGLAVSPDGSRVFVTGESPGAGPFEPDYATVAYDAADGSERWVARYDGSGHGADIAKALAISPDGRRVFVTGSSWAGERTSYDYATVSYDAADGAQQWVSTYNGFANGIESPWALAVSPDGSKVVVTGQNLDVGTDLPDYATASYDATNGREQWIARYDGPALGIDIPRAAAVTPDGRRVVVSGQSEGLETRDDYATVAYDVVEGR